MVKALHNAGIEVYYMLDVDNNSQLLNFSGCAIADFLPYSIHRVLQDAGVAKQKSCLSHPQTDTASIELYKMRVLQSRSHAYLIHKWAKALAEKNMRDILVQGEQAERNVKYLFTVQKLKDFQTAALKARNGYDSFHIAAKQGHLGKHLI
ncbi:uncharacterized protein LOC131232337 [Magnolia sinica]|uniref:uncharacterized protein LOC131232337 n=1 Tax=Magnolia sinica TaxID=86752 RepID=UPI002659B17B|nr:uncharacterized protein LOC131232337 [Magnolia sinica]